MRSLRWALLALLVLGCKKPVVYGTFTGEEGGSFTLHYPSERNDPNAVPTRFEGTDDVTVTAEPGGVLIEWAGCEFHAVLRGRSAIFNDGQSCNMMVAGRGMNLISRITGQAIFTANRIELNLTGYGPDMGGGAASCDRSFRGTTAAAAQ